MSVFNAREFNSIIINFAAKGGCFYCFERVEQFTMKFLRKKQEST